MNRETFIVCTSLLVATWINVMAERGTARAIGVLTEAVVKIDADRRSDLLRRPAAATRSTRATTASRRVTTTQD